MIQLNIGARVGGYSSSVGLPMSIGPLPERKKRLVAFGLEAHQKTLTLMKAGKPAFVEERFLSFEDAHRLIRELGGIPSYPPLADSASPICATGMPCLRQNRSPATTTPRKPSSSARTEKMKSVCASGR